MSGPTIQRWRPSKGDINKIKMETSATGKYVRYADFLAAFHGAEQDRIDHSEWQSTAEQAQHALAGLKILAARHFSTDQMAAAMRDGPGFVDPGSRKGA